MRIGWSAPALAHLGAIQEYLTSQASSFLAERFVHRLIASVERLERFPNVGRLVPETGGRHRELICRPYRIIYRVDREQVLVVAVLHGRRDFATAIDESLEALERSLADEPS